MSTVSVQDKAAIQGRRIFRADPLSVHPQPEKKSKIKRTLPKIRASFNKKSLIITGILGVILLGGLVAWYEYNLQQDPAIIYTKKLKTLTNQIGKYMTLPKDEDPISATVTDTKVLPHEIFFKNARNGDKILMYKKHKIAILYRPLTDQVITQAKLDFQDVTATPTFQQPAVAGASTSADFQEKLTPTVSYHPQEKLLVAPQQ